MSKKFNSLIIILLTITLLSGCAAKPETTINTLFTSMKNFNLEEIRNVVNPESKEKNNENSLDQYTEEDETSKKVLEYLEEKAKKIEYDIKDTKINKDKATANVHVKYIDGTKMFSNVFSEFMEEAISLAFTDIELSDEKSDEIFNSILDEEIKSDEERFIEKDIKINLIKKDNKWYIDDLNDDLLDVLSTNLNSLLNTLDDEFYDDSLSDGVERVIINKEDTFKLQTIELKVNNIEETKKLTDNITKSEKEANEGSKFVLLDVDIKNITKEPLDLDIDGMVLKDNEDRTFDEYEDTMIYIDNYINFRKIGPGLTENGIIVYNVPEESKDFRLLIKSGKDEKLYEMKLK